MRERLILVCAIALSLVAAPVRAQSHPNDSTREWKSSTGSILRQHADTVWWTSPKGLRERAVKHGSIVELTYWHDGFETFSRWDIRGDSAHCLLNRDSTGKTLDTARVVLRARDILALFASAAAERRMDSLGMPRVRAP